MKKSLTLVLGTFALSTIGHFSLAKEISSSKTNNEWLSVTDNPEAIAEAQVDAKRQSREGFVHAYQGLGDFYMSSLDFLRFERNREWVPWLKMQITLPHFQPLNTNISLLLLQLRDPEAQHNLVYILKNTNDRADKIRLLKELLSFQDEMEFVPIEFMSKQKLLTEALLELLDEEDDEIVLEALKVLTRHQLELPKVRTILLELLEIPDVQNKDEMMYLLATGNFVLDTELWEATYTISQQEGVIYHKGGSILCKFAKEAEGELQGLARDELVRQIKEYPHVPGYEWWRHEAMKAVAETSRVQDLPWLIERFQKEPTYYSSSLLTAIVRLEGDCGKDRLLKLFPDPSIRKVAYQVAGNVFKNTGDDEVVQAIQQHAPVDWHERVSACKALKMIGGCLAKEVWHQFEKLIKPEYRDKSIGRWDDYHFPPVDIDAMVNVLNEAGIVDRKVSQNLMQKVETLDEDLTEGYPSILLFYFLMGAQKLLFLFPEDGVAVESIYPQREIVSSLARISGEKFNPKYISVVPELLPLVDPSSLSRLRFVFNEKLYTAQLRYGSEKYDILRSVGLMNKALEDASIKERYIAFQLDDELSGYIFADPAVLKPIAQKYELAILDD